ncbi:MAG: hypothetical protein WC149_02470 [Arcobacteraceae bacterium]
MHKDLFQTKDDHIEHLLCTYNYFDNFINNQKNVQLFHLQTNINTLISMMQPLLHNNSISIYNQCPDYTINVCESEITLVLLNILNNSFYELTKNKTLKKRYIFIEAQLKENSSLEIHIKDTRKTLNPNTIFKDYSNTSEVKQNADMRLFSSYKIVQESLKGELRVEHCDFLFENKKLACTDFIITIKECSHA